MAGVGGAGGLRPVPLRSHSRLVLEGGAGGKGPRARGGGGG